MLKISSCKEGFNPSSLLKSGKNLTEVEKDSIVPSDIPASLRSSVNFFNQYLKSESSLFPLKSIEKAIKTIT